MEKQRTGGGTAQCCAVLFRRGADGDFADLRNELMDVDLIFKIAAVGILVAVLNQLLVRSGREEQAMMTTLAGLVVVMMMMVQADQRTVPADQDAVRLLDGAGDHRRRRICVIDGAAGAGAAPGQPGSIAAAGAGGGIRHSAGAGKALGGTADVSGRPDGAGRGFPYSVPASLQDCGHRPCGENRGAGCAGTPGRAPLRRCWRLTGTVCALLAALPLLRSVLNLIGEPLG